MLNISAFEQSIQLPNIKQATNKYVISAYGAKQNLQLHRTRKAINKLIALVSKKGGGAIIIPKVPGAQEPLR